MSSGSRIQGVTCYVPSRACDGYTLFTPLGGAQGAWLIDMEGRFVHQWDLGSDPGGAGELLPNGNLLSGKKLRDNSVKIAGTSGILVEFDWDSNEVWRYEDAYMHHDLCRMPNGNTMILRFVETPPEIARKVKGGMPGTEANGIMYSDSFREITPDGEVVWEWLGYEHLDPETDAMCPLCHRAEWTHANTCEVLPNGDILTSFLTLNTVAIIDKKYGNIKWRWGPGEIAHQHTPSMLENGNILIFDNGTHRPATHERPHPNMHVYSRLVEVNPSTNEIVWSYQPEATLSFFSPFASGCQRLPNGNTLATDIARGSIFEVTMDGELVWEYINPFYSQGLKALGISNAVFRAIRYTPDDPGLMGKSLDANDVMLTLKQRSMESKLQARLRRLGY